MSKTPKTIRYSSLSYLEISNKIKINNRLYPRNWSLEHAAQFRLYQEIWKDLGKLFRWLKKEYRKEFLVAFIMTIAFSAKGYAVSPVKSLPPPVEVQPYYIHPVSHLQPIQAVSFAVPSEVSPVPEPVAPAPVSAPVAAPTVSYGCVSGYSTGDYYLDKIITYESGGGSCATNYLGCFGLLQACPGSPLRDACGGNPTCQIAWFQANKTGGRSWAQVWQHELDFGWW